MTTESPVEVTPPPASRTPLWIVLAGGAGLVVGALLVLAIQGAMSAFGGADTRLVDAVNACKIRTGIEVGDEGKTVSIDVWGEEDTTGASYAIQACIIAELDAPTRVIKHIEQTTAMDGRQTESWDGITIDWSYHPDRGSDMVITLDDN